MICMVVCLQDCVKLRDWVDAVRQHQHVAATCVSPKQVKSVPCCTVGATKEHVQAPQTSFLPHCRQDALHQSPARFCLCETCRTWTMGST